MTPDPDRVQKILNTALAMPANQRPAFVAGACGGDASLQAEVASLLEHATKSAQEIAHAHTTPDRPSKRSGSSVDANIGRTIDRYTINSLLGEGGFGMVYRATQSDPIRRDVALKIIKPGMDSKSVLARFESERQALAIMDHPGIARILDAGTTDQGHPYFVMEYVKGIPFTLFSDTNRLDLVERINLFMDVCEAVQHAHSKGVIHRDLKPSNILATYENGRPAIKIIDFGIAKALNQQLTEGAHITQDGKLIGTPEYMSPEQAEMSAIGVDTRSDVYSLGVLLYELLTGQLPFESSELKSGSIAEIQRVIREEDPPRPSMRYDDLRSSSMEISREVAKSRAIDPSLLQKRLRGDLDWIVMKCLEKPPVRRYTTADALATDLRRYLGNEPVEAGPPTVLYRFRKFAVRRTGLLASTAMVFVVLLAGVITSTLLWLEADHQREAVELRDRELVKLLLEYDEFYRGIYLDDGMMEARDQINDVLSPSIDALLESAPENVKYRVAKVQSLLRQAELSGGRRSGNLGDPGDALALRKQATDISSTLVAEYPDNGLYRKLLAGSRQSVGDTYKSLQQYQEALSAYSEALVDAEMNSEPGVPSRLVYSLQMSIGDMHKKSGNLDAAREYYDLSMASRMLHVNAHPDDPMGRRDIANMHLRTAALATETGDHEDALQAHREALVINEELFRSDPVNAATHRRDCGNANFYIAASLLVLEKQDEANDHYAASLQLLCENLRRTPSDARTRRNLADRVSHSDQFNGEEVERHVSEARSLLER